MPIPATERRSKGHSTDLVVTPEQADWTPLTGIVGTWIAPDEASVENGCMQLIPCSHLDGPAPHFHVRDCQIADARVRVDRVASIPLRPGGVLFFSGLLYHGTPPTTRRFGVAHSSSITRRRNAKR